MRIWSTVVLSSLALLVIAGCGGPSEKKLVGFWVQEYEDEQQQSIADVAAQIQGSSGASTSMSIDMKKDHTFEFAVGGVASSGTWKLDGETVTLTYTDAKGMVLGDGDTVELAFSANGKELTFNPGKGSSASALFVKTDD